MLKIYLLISIITTISFAQKMTLDVRDYFTKKAITLDSINIKNEIIGIDTTFISPNKIDITDILIINSVQQKRYFDISLNNNQLEVISNERIKNIQMFDLLGREVINANLNNTNYQTNINSENITLFYFISIRTDKGLYNSKLINSTYENLQIANVMPTSNTWKITSYKYGYITETLVDTVIPPLYKISLKKIPLTVSCNINLSYLYYSTVDRASGTNNYGEGEGSVSLNFTLNLFSIEEYSPGYDYNARCYYFDAANYDYVGYTQVSGNTYYTQYGLKSSIINNEKTIDFEWNNISNYTIYHECFSIAIYNFILNDLYSGKVDFITFDLSKGEANASYRRGSEFVWSIGSYKSESVSTGTNTVQTGTITLKLEK